MSPSGALPLRWPTGHQVTLSFNIRHTGTAVPCECVYAGGGGGSGGGELDWWHNNACLSVCAHACFGNDLKFIAPRPPGSFRAPQTKSASDHTDMSFGVPNFCSPTANQWSVPRIHSHFDHAHTHDRARPPLPRLSFTVQRCRNSQHMFGKMNVLQRGQTVTQCTTLDSFG